jgi:hypothetical protein
MKKINSAILKAGDIVLTTSTELVSKGIRFATRSDISHAMVCVEAYSVIDATSEGVHARNVQRFAFEDECAVYILRPKQPLDDKQLKAVCDFARQAVGTEYTRKEAVLTRVGGRSDFSRKQFCSRLVAQAFESAGIQLVKDANYCSPEGLKNSPLLMTIEPSWLPLTEEEASAWEKNADATQTMRDVTNRVLGAVRARDPSIQSLNDIDAYLIEHPEDDDLVLEAYLSSGYMEVWKEQPVKNPWLYDLDEMKKAPVDQMIEYCETALVDEANRPNRYLVNHGGYALYSKQYGLKTFAALEHLYGLLASVHEKRVAVARSYLELKGLRQATVASVLRPHSPEWFAALEVWNPPQAMMTRMAIAAMGGNENVCSICGDDPANDYRLPEAYRSPGGVDTLRLCDECLQIKRRTGEPFEALAEETK